MGGGIVIGHGPADGQEAKHERPTVRCPSGDVVDVGEDVFGGVFGGAVALLGHGQKSDAAGNEGEDVEDDITFGHFLHPVRRKRVHQTGEDGKAGHDTNGLAGSGFVFEVSADGHSSEEQLSSTIFRGGDTGNLTEDIQPADDPTDGWNPFPWE